MCSNQRFGRSVYIFCWEVIKIFLMVSSLALLEFSNNTHEHGTLCTTRSSSPLPCVTRIQQTPDKNPQACDDSFSSWIVTDNKSAMEMEMDSHGGHEVTIRQTEWKKNYPTTSWHRPLSARNEHQSHPLAGQAQACGRLIRRMDRGPDGTC